MALVILLLWAVGVVAGLRGRAWTSLLVTIGGAGSLVVLLSAMQKWTLGDTHTNLFLVPLLYVLAAVGAETSLQAASRHSRASGGRLRTGATAVLVAFAVVVGGVGAYWTWSLRDFAERPLLADRMPALVSSVRAQAAPGTS